MKRWNCVVLSLAMMLLLVDTAPAADWLQWRGPHNDQRADDGAVAPTQWSDTEGLAWETPIPGRGHSSPTVVGERIYLTTADPSAQTQSLLILDRQSGELLREVLVHQGGLPEQIHNNNSHASPTVASDGERVFTLFYNNKAARATAYDLDGNQIWQRNVARFDPQMLQFGFGPSPRLLDGKLIIASEFDGPECGLYALDPATGDVVWQTLREPNITFSTPSPATYQGEEAIMLTGGRRLCFYRLSDGKLLAETKAPARATCGTMVWDQQLNMAFAGGGYPDAFVIGVSMDKEPKIVWQHRVKVYEQSMIVHEGHLYAMTDRGVMYCWRASDGQEMWKKRLGGPVSSSPVLVDGNLYVTNERATTFVFRATPEGYEEVARNQLGDDCFPTPTPLDGRLYHRFGRGMGEARQAYLAAIGE